MRKKDVFKTQWGSADQDAAEKLVNKFLNAKIEKRFILGQNVYTTSVLSNFEVSGILDNQSSESYFPGVPLVKIEDVPKDAIVLNAAGGRPKTAKRWLEKYDLENIDYFAFRQFANAKLTDVVFNENFEDIFDKNHDKFNDLLSLLEDEESRSTLARLISFRLTKNIRHLETFDNNEKNQYFEDFLGLNASHPTFLDVGGFDGMTSREFMMRFPHHGRVVILEPEKENFDRCTSEFSGDPRVIIVNAGASSKRETLRFSAGGSGSRVSDSGSLEINVDKIDNMGRYFSEQPDFIKMDIEGYELEALLGARETIITKCPTLAVCVYHDPEHFWKVPELVLSMNNNYKIYLRHYTESIYETVMYFIPQSEI